MAKIQNCAEFKPIKKRVCRLIKLKRLVRNWIPTALVYISPFVQRDEQFLVETRSGLKFILRPKFGDLIPSTRFYFESLTQNIFLWVEPLLMLART